MTIRKLAFASILIAAGIAAAPAQARIARCVIDSEGTSIVDPANTMSRAAARSP